MTFVTTLCSRVAGASRRIEWLPPLLMRLVLGVTFVLAGWGKLGNLDGVAAYFRSLGIPAADLQAPFIAGLELGGGILVLAGLGTRLVAMLLALVMTVAIATAIWPAQTVTGVLGSIEAAYLAGFLYLAVGGAGAVSLDRLARRYVPSLRAGEPHTP